MRERGSDTAQLHEWNRDAEHGRRAGTSVTAETKGNNLDFYALNVKNNLTVNGTLNATTKVVYTKMTIPSPCLWAEHCASSAVR